MLHKKPTILSGEKPLPLPVKQRIDWIVSMDTAVRDALVSNDAPAIKVLASQYKEHGMVRTANMVSRLLAMAESEPTK